MLQDILNKNTTIGLYGYGVSNRSVHQYFQVYYPDIKIIIFDDNNLNNIENYIQQQTIDLIVISPSIPPENNILLQCKEYNIPIYTELDLAIEYIYNHNKKIIAITGTNGKSTITAWLAYSLGLNAYGNIGKPLIDVALEDNLQEIYIVEVSSYQLFHSQNIEPYIAIISNLTEDHLVWHKTFEEYKKAKFKIKHNCQHLINQDSNHNHKHTDYINNHLIGNHNQYNGNIVQQALAQILEDNLNPISSTDIQNNYNEFRGLEHRLEIIPSHLPNISIYNDSKATTPESTIVAIESLPANTTILILGGKDKFTSLDNLIDCLVQNQCLCLIYGEAQERLYTEIQTKYPEYIQNIKKFRTLAEIIQYIKDHGLNQYSYIFNILFSPAFPSFDQFKNFEHRGHEFKRLCQEYGL